MESTQEISERIAADPFGQSDFYFSESQRQLIAIEQMPLPYARNVFVKLTREFPIDFAGSNLRKALYRRLVPTRQQLRQLLASQGEVAIWAPNLPAERKARKVLYIVGSQIERKVTTHKDGEFVIGLCDPVRPNIRVRGVRTG